MKNKKNLQDKIHFEISSGNIFADLGFENPEEELLKANLTMEITKIIKQKKLTQAKAAKVMGVDQPRVSSLIRGRLDLFSVERLMHFLNTLDQDVDIIVKPKPRNRKKAHLLAHTPSQSHKTPTPIAAKGN